MKLTLIGGGGVRSPLFVMTLLRWQKRVGVDELCLLDVDERKLSLFGPLCRELVHRGGDPFKVTTTMDAFAALSGTDHVVTTIRPGFEQGRATDERIAFRHGVLGQETTGPGGFAMALRSIPAILGYAKLLREVSPKAWMYNFTNPAGLVTQGVRDAGYDRIIGICDGANGGQPSRLKQLIADRIPWEALPWTATPRLLAELKETLLKMRDAADIRLLRFSELAQRLKQALPGERFGESEVRTAVTLLANHGLALPLKFGDLVLLQPELLNGYAGAIIRTARAHRDEIGCVLEADIYQPDFDFTGVDRLARPDEELLLRAMVQTFLDHSLCIAEDTAQGRELVFPSQYRREKDIPHDPNIFVSYTFNGEWQTIWTTLVVRLWYSQEFEHASCGGTPPSSPPAAETCWG